MSIDPRICLEISEIRKLPEFQMIGFDDISCDFVLNGRFYVYEFSNNYPYTPPKITITDLDTNVLVNFSLFENYWSPSQTIRTACVSIDAYLNEGVK